MIWAGILAAFIRKQFIQRAVLNRLMDLLLGNLLSFGLRFLNLVGLQPVQMPRSETCSFKFLISASVEGCKRPSDSR